MTNTEPTLPQKEVPENAVRRRTIKSFAVLVAGLFGGWQLFSWVKKAPPEAGTAKPLRRVLSANETVFKKLFNDGRTVTEYPVEAAVKNVRVNGLEGLRNPVDAAWQLMVRRADGRQITVSLDAIKALPKKEVVFDFKCIEGWSMITRWAGVPLKAFLDHYGLAAEQTLPYISLQTPDQKYYVGIDMASALHPQTLLCYEVNGAPLTPQHGAPLRLIIPVKYGIKHLKRIGTLSFSAQKPPDYWAERGYDYYAGH